MIPLLLSNSLHIRARSSIKLLAFPSSVTRSTTAGTLTRREGFSHAREHAAALRSRAGAAPLFTIVGRATPTSSSARSILTREGVLTWHAGTLILGTVHVMQRCLTGLARAICGLFAFLRRDPLSAVRAGIVLLQPSLDAVEMKPMMARQFGDLGAELSLVHANTAVCLATIAEVLLRDGSLGQCFYRLFGSWWGRIASLMLLHQLRHDAIKALLRVDMVAHHAPSGQAQTEHLENVAKAQWCSRYAVSAFCRLSSRTWRHAKDEGATMMMTGPMTCWHCANVHEHLSHHSINMFRLVCEELWLIRISWAEVGAGRRSDCVGESRSRTVTSGGAAPV